MTDNSLKKVMGAFEKLFVDHPEFRKAATDELQKAAAKEKDGTSFTKQNKLKEATGLENFKDKRAIS